MDFFHPLTLGIPRQRQPLHETDRRPSVSYDSWKEGLSPPLEEYEEEHREAVVLDRIRGTGAAGPGIWLILGEPGAGKTRLLQEWQTRWIAGLAAPRLGLRVPVLVRLRNLKAADLTGAPDEIVHRLWAREGQAVAKAEAKGRAAAAIFDLPLRLFSPVWLLDGLDEAPVSLADEELWDRLVNLPGEVVATCRTAVYQPTRSVAARRVAMVYRILGLKPSEQPHFLARALEAEGQDPTRAPTLVRQLNAQPPVRPLVAIPFFLSLVAQGPDQLVLPRNRAGFYEAATRELWHRRLHREPALYELAGARDGALEQVPFNPVRIRRR